jgi:NADH:ubiquinone oxidoreductase subunit 5 (subunit L)/multisubunit Na+/H+ antiporter MnhA subunit
MDSPEAMRQKAQQPAKWIEWLARFGYASKGIVYVSIGFLAFQAAFNWGGKVTGSKGAFQTIAAQPFGKTMLFLVAVGLVGYVVWKFVQAIKNPGHDDQGAKAFGRRAVYAISGLIYGSLAWFAFRVVFSNPSSSGGSSDQQTATLLSQPFGQWLVGAVGVASVAYGFYCFYRAITTRFHRKFKLAEMSQKEQKWSTRIARFGLSAKGVVSVIVGYFFIQAARTSDPSQTKNTEGALQTLQQQPYGAWLMGIVALGLVAYGVHLIIQARYRRISP